MPTNKDALIRIKILDDLLSNKGHRYTWDELVEEVNGRLLDFDKTQVTRRCIEKDVAFIESYFGGDIRRERVAAESERGRPIEKVRVYYDDSNFSIFSKKISSEEAYLLKQIVGTLGQFDGLPDFSVIAGLVNSKFAKSFENSIGERHIISFEKNPLEDNKNIFAKLFLAISREQVIKLNYHLYSNTNDIKHILFHPYFLKEYNHRWFVFGIADSDQFKLQFALDRIDEVEPLPANKYIEYNGQFDEWFDDIIGVSKQQDDTLHKIIFWVSEKEHHYIATKPLHLSQKTIKNDSDLRSKYPQLKGGTFFSIECMKNYELIRELCSYAGDLVVLEPTLIKEDVIKRIKSLCDAYKLVAETI